MTTILQILRPAIAGMTLTVSAFAAQSMELVMVEQAGCHYCARWHAEIGPIYPKTTEAAIAPLRRVELRGAGLEALSLQRRVTFTPTFLLVDETGVELARLEGYPGEDFFWGLLGRMLQELTETGQPAGDG